MWQDLMLTQFHDCLPGTTIRTVVDDNIEIYTKRGNQAQTLIKEALEVLQVEGTPSVVDPLRLAREGVINNKGELSWYQTTSGGMGSLEEPADLVAPQAKQEGEAWILSNSHYSLTIQNGRITSIVDIRLDRELITPGPGAEDAGLVLYEDFPLTYDAWDAEIYHLQSYETIKFDSVELVQGPLRASLVVTAKFGDSSARLTVSGWWSVSEYQLNIRSR
jgi:alpha-mannosidase